MVRYVTRQPFIERCAVNPPAAADLEAGKFSALYQAIDGSGMHAQYVGDLGDSENTPEFPMLDPTPFHRPTDLRSRDLNLPKSLLRRESRFPEPRDMQTLVTLFQISVRADVHMIVRGRNYGAI